MQDTSLWSFFIHASLVVQCVLLILFVASIVSWTIIIQRLLLLAKTKKLMKEFEEDFESMENLKKLQQKIPSDQSVLSRVFHAGLKEYQDLVHNSVARDVIVENTKRVMRITQQRGLQPLESNVSILATIGSTSPYVGLFGTVWGILSSFQALGGVSQATISMVAPGISEALIATAVGLFAAIPAVIGYNRLTHSIDGISENIDIFQEELLGLFQKQTAISHEAQNASE